MATDIGPLYNPLHRLPLSELSPHAIFDSKTPPVPEILLRIDGGRLSFSLRRRFNRSHYPELGCARELRAQPAANPKPCTRTRTSTRTLGGPRAFTCPKPKPKPSPCARPSRPRSAAAARAFALAASRGAHGSQRIGPVHSSPWKNSQRQPERPVPA